MPLKRKLQVSNGHYLSFDQLARLLHTLNSQGGNRLKMEDLETETGLPIRQVRNRVSMARALGICEEKKLGLTSFGALIAAHDTFLEAKGTLEYMHYSAAGDLRNLIWYEVFNTLLPDESAMDYHGWVNYFRSTLAGQYTDYSLKKHLAQEIRFVIEAYLDGSFQNLDLLNRAADGRLYRRRYLNPEPLMLAAMLYDHAGNQQTQTLQVGEMPQIPGAPPRVLGMDEASFRQQTVKLHEKGYLRYEGTHNLDQIRLKPDYQALNFLQAYYQGTEPQAMAAGSTGLKGSK
jgi:hypothetical protein